MYIKKKNIAIALLLALATSASNHAMDLSDDPVNGQTKQRDEDKKQDIVSEVKKDFGLTPAESEAILPQKAFDLENIEIEEHSIISEISEEKAPAVIQNANAIPQNSVSQSDQSLVTPAVSPPQIVVGEIKTEESNFKKIAEESKEQAIHDVQKLNDYDEKALDLIKELVLKTKTRVEERYKGTICAQIGPELKKEFLDREKQLRRYIQSQIDSPNLNVNETFSIFKDAVKQYITVLFVPFFYSRSIFYEKFDLFHNLIKKIETKTEYDGKPHDTILHKNFGTLYLEALFQCFKQFFNESYLRKNKNAEIFRKMPSLVNHMIAHLHNKCHPLTALLRTEYALPESKWAITQKEWDETVKEICQKNKMTVEEFLTQNLDSFACYNFFIANFLYRMEPNNFFNIVKKSLKKDFLKYPSVEDIENFVKEMKNEVELTEYWEKNGCWKKINTVKIIGKILRCFKGPELFNLFCETLECLDFDKDSGHYFKRAPNIDYFKAVIPIEDLECVNSPLARGILEDFINHIEGPIHNSPEYTLAMQFLSNDSHIGGIENAKHYIPKIVMFEVDKYLIFSFRLLKAPEDREALRETLIKKRDIAIKKQDRIKNNQNNVLIGQGESHINTATLSLDQSKQSDVETELPSVHPVKPLEKDNSELCKEPIDQNKYSHKDYTVSDSPDKKDVDRKNHRLNKDDERHE